MCESTTTTTQEEGHTGFFIHLPHSFWISTSLDVPAGLTQEEGHTGFFIHLPSAVRALTFLARRIQPFLSLVDREIESCVLNNDLIVLHSLGIFLKNIIVRKSRLPGSNSRPNVPEGYEVTSELPGRPAVVHIAYSSARYKKATQYVPVVPQCLPVSDDSNCSKKKPN